MWRSAYSVPLNLLHGGEKAHTSHYDQRETDQVFLHLLGLLIYFNDIIDIIYKLF